MSEPVLRRHRGGFTWDDVDLLRYKQEGEAPFRDVTRQVLFDGGAIAVRDLSGAITVTDSTFTGFNSNGGYIYYTSTTEPGGAVRVEAGDLHVSDSTFDSNSSYAEGGAISVGTITGDSSIMRSTFSNNFTIALNNTGGAGLAVGCRLARVAVPVPGDPAEPLEAAT